MKKALKVAMLLGLVSLVVLAAGVVVSAAKKPIPEYVGSKACLGCHSDKWSSWAGSGHGTMIMPVRTPADIPGLDMANPEQRAELLNADFVVSGARFLARDGATGNLVFLKYEWVAAENQYIDYDEPGSIWQNQCYGCHITPMSRSGVANQPEEFGIGCENCHGPGRDHIAGKGDTSKIVLNTSSDVCGVCHNSGYKMTDGNRWVVGYRPNMKLSEVSGFTFPAPVDPTVAPGPTHHSEYPQWLVSAHGPKAVADLKSSNHATGNCYACHTQEAYAAKESGTPFTLDTSADYVAISCVTCHRPHGLGLAADESTLCITCHTGSIPDGGLAPGATAHHPMKEFFGGFGAAGGLVSKGNVHKDITCQECHMTDNNHLMKVVRPDDPTLKPANVDSCTACHKESSKEVRAAYLEMWEESTTGKIVALKENIAAIEAAVAAGATLTDNQKLKLDTSKTNIGFIEADGSKGAHNFDYATRILSVAQNDIATVKAAVVK